MERILCKFHEERTPSCVLYDTVYHCYSCGAHGPLKDLGIADEDLPLLPRYVEDIVESIKRIMGLPKQSYRGLDLPYDNRGHYVLWPQFDYYKLRQLGAIHNSDKYRCPSGVRKPVFYISTTERDVCCVVEGELNALSAANLGMGIGLVSPGGAGDFYGATLKEFAPTLASYKRVVVVVDNDSAGALAYLKFCEWFKDRVPVSGHLINRDFNEILQEEGKDALKKYVTKLVGV